MVYRHHSCHGFRVSFSSHCARSSSPRARGQRRFRDVRVQVHVLLRRKRLGVVRVKDTSQFHDTILRSRHRRRRARSVPPPRDLALPDNRFTSNLNARARSLSRAPRRTCIRPHPSSSATGRRSVILPSVLSPRPRSIVRSLDPLSHRPSPTRAARARVRSPPARARTRRSRPFAPVRRPPVVVVVVVFTENTVFFDTVHARVCSCVAASAPARGANAAEKCTNVVRRTRSGHLAHHARPTRDRVLA